MFERQRRFGHSTGETIHRRRITQSSQATSVE